ncbi:MAG: tRNA uridine-5-carboxymethylaminomethyl(34) synthesis GTPase MnmE [Gemmatimonas sp.]
MTPSSEQSGSMFSGGDDTIAAIATAPGRGAVALIRISGPRAFAIATALGAPEGVLARAATRCVLRDPRTGETLDDLLATRFVSPNSFTGEDVIELSTHGGRVVPNSVLAACLRAGARQALPGEFTRRALLNGRIDLLQAEAIADLVDARTGAMQQQALVQLDGGLSRRLSALRNDIISLEVLLAYDIDFPEEDDGPIAPSRIENASRRLTEQLRALLATAPRAAMVRDGALVVIAGPPNAGKSSLFNALLGEARALVTEIPGTTRDAIEALLDTPGVPLRLVDTAGLRTTDDIVEKLGIEVSEKYVAQAQLVLACAEDVEGLQRTIDRVRPLTSAPIVSVLTKSDRQSNSEALLQQARVTLGDDVELVSDESGAGLSALLTRATSLLREASSHGAVSTEDAAVLTRERHRIALAQALSEMEEFERARIEDEIPAMVAAVHLRSAVHAIEELIGAVDVEDVLDRLFREFCVGK